MKLILQIIFILLVFNKGKSQCSIDSVEFNYYTIMDIHDNISFNSIDSTLKYDKPNSSWIDYYKNDLIIKRVLKGSLWNKNYYTFEYLNQKISKVVKHTKGFESLLEFEYNNEDLVKIINSPKYFESTVYIVSLVKGVYKLNFTNKHGMENSHEINLNRLGICGGIKYGKIDFLNFTLDLNINHSSSDEDYTITCEKDECGNTTLYAKQINETKKFINLYYIKYYYKQK